MKAIAEEPTQPGIARAGNPWSIAREARRWLVGLLLASPAALPYLSHYWHPGGLLPTGFIQYDMGEYMADGRAYFDSGFHFTYANPFSFAYDGPRIYFQPVTLLFGLIWRLTGLDPGSAFVVAAILGAALCARAALALYE